MTFAQAYQEMSHSSIENDLTATAFTLRDKCRPDKSPGVVVFELLVNWVLDHPLEKGTERQWWRDYHPPRPPRPPKLPKLLRKSELLKPKPKPKYKWPGMGGLDPEKTLVCAKEPKPRPTRKQLVDQALKEAKVDRAELTRWRVYKYSSYTDGDGIVHYETWFRNGRGQEWCHYAGWKKADPRETNIRPSDPWSMFLTGWHTRSYEPV